MRDLQSGIIEETVNEAVDSALDSEDIEEEIEEEVEKVLTALAGETAAQLPEAVRRKEKLKQPARVAGAEVEVYAIILSADAFSLLPNICSGRIINNVNHACNFVG